MTIPYHIEVHDNLISKSIQTNIWKHVQELEFYGVWNPEETVRFEYTLSSPRSPGDWMLQQSMKRSARLHRSPLSSDEIGLKSKSLPIYLLWTALNKQLGNQYQLTGNPEGMYSPDPPNPPTDTDLSAGWRAYINATYNAQIYGGQGYAHRDTPLELNDPDTVTMIYFLNLEWYPSWAGEIKFFPEDHKGSSGDHQQFNSGLQQKRGYNIGWVDQGRIVSPVPGRLLIYDGRCLHGTNPTNGPVEMPSIKIVFRAKRISV